MIKRASISNKRNSYKIGDDNRGSVVSKENLVYLVILHQHFPLLPSLQQSIDAVALGVVVT
jgi:hypothetical protein